MNELMVMLMYTQKIHSNTSRVRVYSENNTQCTENVCPNRFKISSQNRMRQRRTKRDDALNARKSWLVTRNRRKPQTSQPTTNVLGLYLLKASSDSSSITNTHKITYPWTQVHSQHLEHLHTHTHILTPHAFHQFGFQFVCWFRRISSSQQGI